MSINSRLHLLRKQLDITQEEIAAQCGIGRAAFGNYEKEGVPVQEYILIILELKYRLNRQWLETGEGEMFLPVYEQKHEISTVNELASEYGSKTVPELLSDIESITNLIRRKLEKDATKSETKGPKSLKKQ